MKLLDMITAPRRNAAAVGYKSRPPRLRPGSATLCLTAAIRTLFGKTPLHLGDEQQAIYDLLEQTTANVYVTGKAGTGKSVLLRYFAEHTSKAAVVVAPTGIAALNARGQTIHSLFKLPPGTIDPHSVRLDNETRTLLQHIDVIVFDEVSMVRADIMEAIHIKCKRARGNNLPFGGIQIVMFGDVYQLPPVVTDAYTRRYLQKTFGGTHFFDAAIFACMPLDIRELTRVYRQNDPEFLDILNAIRVGHSTPELLEKLNTRTQHMPPASGVITLTGTNRAATAINKQRLTAIRGRERTYQAIISGTMPASNYPTETDLQLKVGAQVILLRNDTQTPRRWVNGTCGVVTKLSSDSVQVAIGRKRYTILPETWDSIDYSYNDQTGELESHVASSFTQFPLRLAWAITIHKSQGQTYESAIIDLADGAYAPGQTYVALSRCKSLDGVYLSSPLRARDIITDPHVSEFMRSAHHNYAA